MNKTFENLVESQTNKRATKEIIYFLSKKVKNINDYLEFKDYHIDFELKKFHETIEKIKNKNIERVLNKVFFYKYEFEIFDNVFCPRNETELLVEQVCKKIKNNKFLHGSKLIDICTGSGVIGISIFLENKKNIKSLTLLDLSSEAIKNTRKNIKNFEIKAYLIQNDWQIIKNKKFEIITANFPYISKYDNYDPSILKYDPSLALFSDDNGWFHYGKILEFAEHNKYWKLIALECSQFHEEIWKSISKKIEYKKFKFEFFYDLQQYFRIVFILRN